MSVTTVLVVSVFASVAFFSVNYLLTRSSKSADPLSNLCKLSTTEKCNLSKMNIGYPSYLVQPDATIAGTYCIDNSPYQFEVIGGATNKLMISFQGGGAGWDYATLDFLPRISTKFCKRNITKQDPYGIYDRSNSNNAFKDYTIVNVLYCSGDLHAGNVTRQLKDFWNKNPVVVKQTGFNNTMATLDWIKSQVTSGYLDKNLDSLIISGQSAGAIGAQLWSHYILTQFNAMHKSVIVDSYLGVFPDQAGPIINGFKICDQATILPPTITTQTCPKLGKDLLQTIAKASMTAHPTVPFAFIQSKQDVFQIGFYALIILDSKLLKHTNGVVVKSTESPFIEDICWFHLLPPKKDFEDYLKCLALKLKVSKDFQSGEEEILAAYAQLRNFYAMYLVDGGTHTFTNKKYYDTTDPSGKTPSPPTPPPGCIKLDTWLNDLINNKKLDPPMCIKDKFLPLLHPIVRCSYCYSYSSTRRAAIMKYHSELLHWILQWIAFMITKFVLK